MTLKVEFDRHTRSIAAVHWLDTPLDIPTNRSVNASDGPRAGWFERSYLRRRCHLAGAGLPGHNDSLADLNWGVIVLNVDDTRLPLRQVRGSVTYAKTSAGVLEISTLSTMVVIACLLFSGHPDDVASEDVASEGDTRLLRCASATRAARSPATQRGSGMRTLKRLRNGIRIRCRELERLADLHARGAFSDVQFETAKAGLLGSLATSLGRSQRPDHEKPLQGLKSRNLLTEQADPVSLPTLQS